MSITPSLQLSTGPLWPELVVPIRVVYLSEIDQCKNDSYLIGLYTNKNCPFVWGCRIH